MPRHCALVGESYVGERVEPTLSEWHTDPESCLWMRSTFDGTIFRVGIPWPSRTGGVVVEVRGLIYRRVLTDAGTIGWLLTIQIRPAGSWNSGEREVKS